MAQVWWMIGPSLGSWLLLAPWVEWHVAWAALLGMIGPLVMAIGSWLVTDVTFRRNPARVTTVMMTAFGVKMLFVGVYVAVAVRMTAIQPLPFISSFTVYFIALYAIEALFLKRLFAGASGGAR